MLPLHPDMTLLDKMVLAVERVRDRLLRASNALESAAIPYAVAGGNAVAAWVATVDAAGVRNTPDVDILVKRSDLDLIVGPLVLAGFRRHSVDIFLDGPDATLRDAVHIVIAAEKMNQESLAPTPDISESQIVGGIRVVTLEALVRMKLTSFRDKDRMHLRDFLDIGLVNVEWTNRFAPKLAARLHQIIDSPES